MIPAAGSAWRAHVCAADFAPRCARRLPLIASLNSDNAPDGTSDVSELAKACRPRYHIAGSSDIFYQREPYENRDLGAGAIATRFISLGTVGNAAKAKWVHALALQPASTMPPEQLGQMPVGCTTSPYLVRAKNKRAVRAAPLATCRL